MKVVTQEEVLAALGRVVDPDSGQDVVSAGMVSGLTIKDNMVGFSLEVDPAKGPSLEPLRKKAELAVEDLENVLAVTAILTAHRKGPATPREAAGKAQAPARQGVSGVKHIVAVASGKGGVGKSTVAVNLALALRSLGLEVGLLDADIYGPSQPRMLGLEGKPETKDGKKLEPKNGYGLKSMSIGYMVAEDTPMIWRGPMVQSALSQMLRDVNWAPLDVLIVDMPPGTGDAQLTMAQQVPLSGAIIVSTPQDIALIDARKGLNMFKKVDIPVLGIIENMSVFVCPNCNHESHIFGHGGAAAEAAKLELPFLGEIPLDLDIRTTSDQGEPIVATRPDSPHTRTFRAIAEKIKVSLEANAMKKGPSFIME